MTTIILIIASTICLALFSHRDTLTERGQIIMFLAGWVCFFTLAIQLVGVVARLI